MNGTIQPHAPSVSDLRDGHWSIVHTARHSYVGRTVKENADGTVVLSPVLDFHSQLGGNPERGQFMKMDFLMPVELLGVDLLVVAPTVVINLATAHNEEALKALSMKIAQAMRSQSKTQDGPSRIIVPGAPIPSKS